MISRIRSVIIEAMAVPARAWIKVGPVCHVPRQGEAVLHGPHRLVVPSLGNLQPRLRGQQPPKRAGLLRSGIRISKMFPLVDWQLPIAGLEPCRPLHVGKQQLFSKSTHLISILLFTRVAQGMSIHRSTL